MERDDKQYHDAVTPTEEPTDPQRECPYCRRICSVREWLNKHACDDCTA